MGARLPLALRLALRELRGGLRGFYVFLACIALGVAAIAGVNSVSRALTEGIAAQGSVILGGDISFGIRHREASQAERAFLEAAGRVGTVATMRAMARMLDGSDQALVELKAVDAAYPLLGEFVLESGGDLHAALAERGGVNGAVAAPELADRLDVAVGDRIALGGIELELRDVVATEPDRLSDGIGFGPRLIVSVEALRATGLVRPGSLVEWIYRVDLPGGAADAAVARLAEEAESRFPEAGWDIDTRDRASPQLERNIERLTQFLTLVGLTALVVGGVGVANAVGSFVDLKRPAIATLKCLGGNGALVFRIYALQIAIIAALGIALGLLGGAALPYLAKALLADLLPIESVPAFYPRELGLALLYGALVAASFALWPLGRIRDLPATGLFADRAVRLMVRPRWRYRLMQAAGLATLAGIVYWLAADRRVALIYIVATIAAFLVLRLVAAAIVWAARRAGPIRGTTLRLAVRNIQRPGALTASVVLSLGLGLTLLVALALIDANLRLQLTGEMAERAPDFYFLDIQDSERLEFEAALARVAPEGEVERVPMLRGRFVALDGVPVSQLDPPQEVRWVTRGDRGLTYAETPPENSRVVAGEWWPAGYDGEPLVSFARNIAEGLGLSIGDTVTVNVLGRNIEARIANLREVDWESLAINFVVVFSPNTFVGAPHAHLATLSLPEGSPPGLQREVMRAVTAEFPGVTTIRVRDALEAVSALIGDLALAVRVAASLALVISMLVLGGALAAGHRQRRQDAVILKALGATRRRLLGAFSLEYGLLGLATAIFAVAAGGVAAWYVVSQVMRAEFTFLPGVAVAAAFVALAVTLGLGLAGTWRILSVRAATHLRNL